jgi:adenosylmethionine-8-amino-7-oxononanoate aminotransferase
MFDTLSNLTAKQLLRAARLREKLDKLEKELGAILNIAPEAPAPVRKAGRRRKAAAASVQAPKGKRRFSAAARVRMAAAAKARWAKVRAADKVVAAAPPALKPERKISKAARTKLAAAPKKRWATGKKSL